MKFLFCLRRWRRSRTIRWHKAYVYTDGNCESCVAPRKAAINDVGGGGGSSLARTQVYIAPVIAHCFGKCVPAEPCLIQPSKALVWRCPQGRSGKHGGRRLLFHPKCFRAECDDETQFSHHLLHVANMSPTVGVIVALFRPLCYN